jgi:hypothetical protein
MSNPGVKLVSYTAPVEELIYQLLHAEIIECTIGVMRHLGHNLTALANHLSTNGNLTSEQKEHLKSILLSLTSESIREALHKGELPITNSIIRTKNQILTTLGVEIPDSHQEIQASDYPNYHW